MIFGVLHVLFFQLESQLFLVLLLLLELVLVFLHCLDVLFEHALIIDIALNPIGVVLQQPVQRLLVLGTDLCHHDLVICLAAVLKQDLKHLPNGSCSLEGSLRVA